MTPKRDVVSVSLSFQQQYLHLFGYITASKYPKSTQALFSHLALNKTSLATPILGKAKFYTFRTMTFA